MFDSLLTFELLKIALTLFILGMTVYGYISEKFSPDVTSLLAILALLITGVLTPEEAFAGFSHPATISVAAVLVLSAGIERTGALTFIARRILAPLGRSEFLLTFVLMLVIGGLSAFINNTAAVAIFIPVVLEVCRRTGASPGRVLMPMSQAATFGGMCTLVGTSTNLVAHEYARKAGLPGFSMFELGQVGLPMMIGGFAYLLLVGRWFLPKNRIEESMTIGQSDPYLSELLVAPDSPWIGQEIDAKKIHRDFDVELVSVVREGRIISPGEGRPRYAVNDSLRVRGMLEKVLAMASQRGLSLHRPESRYTEESFMGRDQYLIGPKRQKATTNGIEPAEGDQTGQKVKLPLAEVVVLTTSGLIGRTLKDVRFAERFDSVVLALKRRGVVTDRPSTTPLHAGDVLVVEGAMESLQALADTRGFLVIGTPAHPEQRPGKMIITIAILAAVIALVSFGVLPIVTAAVAGSAALILTGCLKPREVYQAIDLSLVFLLAGTLALGMALEKAGITKYIAEVLGGLTDYTGPYTILICFFLVSVLISEFMSNSGTCALLAPVAVSSAFQMGINPMALIAAITFGSSAAFAMPVGYQTNLMIYGPGGYRFRDFFRVGIALDILLAILALWLIPRFWPLIK
ncbi:MAG: SLC13 family permease [Acidobacteriota bacterium]|nr:MAG: SLC13 family permease [Acidobacteriota bacterium]